MTNLEIVVGEWQNEDPTEKITEMTKADDQAAAQICWDSGKVHPLQEKQILIAVENSVFCLSATVDISL